MNLEKYKMAKLPDDVSAVIDSLSVSIPKVRLKFGKLVPKENKKIIRKIFKQHVQPEVEKIIIQKTLNVLAYGNEVPI